MSGARVKVFLAVGFVVTVLASILIGQLVFVVERTFPSEYAADLRLPSAEQFINGTDKPGGLLLSLTLGLFVLVGFAVRSLPRPRLFSPFVLGTGGGFLAVSIFSLYMGFMARMVALYYASFPEPSSIGIVGTFLLLQATGVAGSGLAAILLLLDLLSASPDEAAKTESRAEQVATPEPPQRTPKKARRSRGPDA
jgi:hypothetical protein